MNACDTRATGRFAWAVRRITDANTPDFHVAYRSGHCIT